MFLLALSCGRPTLWIKAAFFIERSRSPHYFTSLWSDSIRKTLICLVVFIASSARDQSLLHTAARQFRQLLKSGSISMTWNEDRSGREKGEGPSPDYIMEKNLKGDSADAPSFYDHNARRRESVSCPTINKTIPHTPYRTQTRSTHEDTR